MGISSYSSCNDHTQVYETDDLPTPIDWRALFDIDPDAPAPEVELEIGCGNGRYLRRAAAERPTRCFFGLERSPGYARRARDRAVKYDLQNVRVAQADATRLIASHVAPGALHALHVYFTDPWPKTRHAKRRLFQTPFLETIHRVVRPGGAIHIKIDLHWYFEEIYCRFERSPHFQVEACGMESDTRRALSEITGFEQKALAKKGHVYYIKARNNPNTRPSFASKTDHPD